MGRPHSSSDCDCFKIDGGARTKGKDPKHDPVLSSYLACCSLVAELRRYAHIGTQGEKTMDFFVDGDDSRFNIHFAVPSICYSRTSYRLPLEVKPYFERFVEELGISIAA